MKNLSIRFSAAAVLCLMASAPSLSFAATVGDLKKSGPIQSQPKVVLPPRSDVLAVDWVDTKNAKIAIGGVTYALMHTPPSIVLAGGEQVSNIGYLKSGMRVRIQITSDNSGVARLTDIAVVNQAP